MLLFITKYFPIIFFSLVNSINIYKKRVTYQQILFFLIYSLGASFILFSVNIVFPKIIVFLLLLIILFATLKILFREKNALVMSLSIISLAITYIVSLASNIIAVGLTHKILPHISDFMILVISAACEILILILLCNFPRIKNSFKYILAQNNANLFLLICSGILLLYTLASVLTSSLDLNIVCILFALCLAPQIYFYWNHSLFKSYQKKLAEQELANAYKTVSEKEEYIRELEFQNAELAKIIHKDNKLIPAMESAVIDFLYSGNRNASSKDSRIIIEQLQKVSQERKVSLTYHHKLLKELPSSHVPLIDTTLSYFHKIATEHGIDFNVLLSADIPYMVEKVLTEAYLRTLLADIIENAIHSIHNSESKKMLLIIEILNNYYQIHLFDSGISFDINVLLSLGTAPITTRAKDGGSGIGWMTSFDIMQTAGASLIITEYPPGSFSFTKCISFCFNTRRQYRIKSYRAPVLTATCTRSDLNIEPLEFI